MSSYDNLLEEAIALAEKQSSHTCEICEMPGKIEKIKGGLKMPCEDHKIIQAKENLWLNANKRRHAHTDVKK